VTDAYHPERAETLVLFRSSQPGPPRSKAAPAGKPSLFDLLTGRRPARAPAGRRIYAIGDIHGRDDLLEELLAKIGRDAMDSGPDRPTLVFLGDYIDRGVHSREVIDRLMTIPKRQFDTYYLRGNHESALLTFLDRPETGATWLTLGGRETMFSYGVRAPGPNASETEFWRAAAALRAAIPPAHMEFLTRLDLYVRLGDYLFVHAGLRPGRPLAKQAQEDILEIRTPFLKSRARWPFVIVHGHSPVAQATRLAGRIALDTGAFATGRLSAVRLDGASVDFLAT
jgi:serine/threonine protein phosphatase 1